MPSIEGIKRYGIPDAPWAEARRGKPINPNWLSRRLKPFDVKPKNLRVEGKVSKGYELRDFDDAFGRYLCEASPVQPATPLQLNDSNHLEPNEPATTDQPVADRNAPNLLNPQGCSGVAAQQSAGDQEETLVIFEGLL